MNPPDLIVTIMYVDVATDSQYENQYEEANEGGYQTATPTQLRRLHDLLLMLMSHNANRLPGELERRASQSSVVLNAAADELRGHRARRHQ